MAPNFCAECGHRLYQHNGAGCTHSDITHVNGVLSDNKVENLREDRCGCTVPHPLITAASGG
jgi:hypothetical protein